MTTLDTTLILHWTTDKCIISLTTNGSICIQQLVHFVRHLPQVIEVAL